MKKLSLLLTLSIILILSFSLNGFSQSYPSSPYPPKTRNITSDDLDLIESYFNVEPIDKESRLGEETKPTIYYLDIYPCKKPNGVSINIKPGWNWVSFPAIPNDTSIQGVLGENIDLVEEIKVQTSGAINHPDYGWIGDLQIFENIANLQMFQILAKQSFDIIFLANGIPYDTPIELNKGWNWVAYLNTCATKSEESLIELLEHPGFVEVKNQTSSLRKLAEGQIVGNLNVVGNYSGLKILMDTEGTFSYHCR